jgi:hypothetical protein
MMERKLHFTYVENLVWVHLKPNNTLECENSSYFKRSKTTLLIFKKGDGLELRHQRNPDVVFDFVKNDKDWTFDKPAFTYNVIETLLPTSRYHVEGEKGEFKLLELWGKKDRKREGWITIAARSLIP